MIEIKNEDIVVVVCASGKITCSRFYRYGGRNASCFCMGSEENTEKNICFYIDPNGEIKESSCFCIHTERRKEIKFVANLDLSDSPDEYVYREHGSTEIII